MLGHASPPGRELLTRLAMSAGLLSPQAAAPCNRNPAGRVAALAGGLVAGAVQAFLLRDRLARSWGGRRPCRCCGALGWTVTAAAGVGVDPRYGVFGAFGTITFMALSGVAGAATRRRPSRAIPAGRPATATA
jgi:hypothetical protein